MAGPEQSQIRLGFVALTDCAPLVVAHELGMFQRHGLDVTLSREISWANIRDKVAVGELDGAQMLAPMVVASHLGIGPINQPVVTSLSLDLNGNAITVSESLYQRLNDQGSLNTPLDSAVALAKVIADNRATGRALLTFATVFGYSNHYYQLRYWLNSAGIDPDRDLRLIVIPPAQMVERLRAGDIQGYCVGEPWNSMAVHQGLGRVLLTGYDIWNNAPEKVLGVTRAWAESNPRTHLALVSAVLEAQRWMDQPAHRPQVVDMISGSEYLDAPASVVRMSMMGTFQFAYNEFPRSYPDFNVFFRYAASFPWRSQALWLLTQMLRWGQLKVPTDLRAVSEAAYRPDVYRTAASGLGVSAPGQDYKTEGAHDGTWCLGLGKECLDLGADRFMDYARFAPESPLGGMQRPSGMNDEAWKTWRALNPEWTPEQKEQWLAREADAMAAAS